MKERPIIFSGPMVRAILEGRKAQTRRILKPRPSKFAPSPIACHDLDEGGFGFFDDDREYKSPYGQPGDRLWVRECFYIDLMPWDVMRLPKHRPSGLGDQEMYYRADGDCCQQIPECSCGEVGKPRWRPSIHMPRWASRLTLEVTGVRVERLQDISHDDAKAEGITFIGIDEFNHITAFRKLWDSINAKHAPWDSNPWVWVVEFRRESY